ncbi:hypothetical protein [Deinococcus pimensis]|uniref:hypothetical protein n=1 Tax=Deinococcus pimensis TaxID=309888 RepID=UPI000485B52D|nr:hypothetical protein [Deinococcus pimensis]
MSSTRLSDHLEQLTGLYEDLLRARLDDTRAPGERSNERETLLAHFPPLFSRATQLWADERGSDWWPGDAALLLRHGKRALPFLRVAYGHWPPDHPDAPTPDAYRRFLHDRRQPPPWPGEVN